MLICIVTAIRNGNDIVHLLLGVEGHYLSGSPEILIALWLKMRGGAGCYCGTEPTGCLGAEEG